MAYDWYQAWLADKQKRDQQAQQDPQTNKVNFHQASMANNIQYTLPNFTGTSGNKGVNSQWEKDMLGPLSIKQYGRSYEDRFNNLTKSMGMNTYQAQDFRRYLDSQEAAKQGYVMKKDGTPDNRHNVTMGQGMQTQNQQIDGILKNMTNPNTPTNQLNTAIQNAGIPDMKVPSAQEQAQNQQDSKPHSWIYNNILNPVNNAVGGAVDYLERAGASGVDALTAGQFKKHINDASAKQALGTAGQQFAANETKDPTNLGQSAADVVGNLYATAPLFMGLGKVADPLANLLTANKYGQAAIRGGLSMGALATGQNAVDAAINPNDATLAQRAKDVGLNTALGAGAEVGLTALGPVAQRIISKLTKGKPISQIAKEEGIPEEQVHQVVNNYSNVLADKKPVMPNPIENPLNINLKQPSPSMDNFSLNPNQIPPVTVPPAANDLFSFIKGNVTPRGAVPKLDNVPRYGKENLQQKADAILQKALPPKFDKPVGYYQDLWNNVANHDGSVFHPQIQQILDHADMLSKDMTQKEQDFVHQYVQDRLSNVAVNDGHVAAIGKKGDLSPEDMRILMDTANQHEANLNTINQQASDYALNHPNYQKAAQKLIDNSGQTNEWQATKQLKQEYQNLKGSLDGINFTASDKANFGDIPQTFKTSSGGIDISKATELLGLKNPEETVNYLQSLAKANRTKMADVVTNPKLGSKAATEAQMKKLNALEKVLQSEYRSKAGAKGIKAQMKQTTDLIAKGKGTNDFHAEAQKAFQDTPYFKSNQQLIDSMQQDLSKLQNPTKEDIYQALRQHNDPQTLQHFVDVATKDMKDFKNSRLKEALISDPRIKQMVKNMSPKKVETVVPKNPQRPAPNFDEVLNLLEGKPNVKKGDKSFLNLKPKGKAQNIDKVLSSLKNEKSISKQSAADSNIKPAAQPKQENVNNSQVKPESDMLFRSNLQQFEDSAPPPLITSDKPIESKTAIQAIKNPVMRKVHSFIESAVNSTHSANIAERHVLENAIKDAKATGLQPEKVKQLQAQLKNVKKSGSTLEMSIQNEKTAGNKTKDFLEHHFGQLQKALGTKNTKDMADALRYQFAQNIHWIWENVNPEYTVGAGWDRGRVNQIINEGVGNTKLENFTKAMRNLTQDWRDKALSSHLINKEQHAALSKNPYYIPMARDISGSMDNIARGFKGGNTSNKSQSGLYFVHALGKGDAEALYKNPMETIINNSFSLFKNLAKADTGTQALKLAKLDKNHLMFREVGKKEFDSNGGIAVPTAKGTKYVQLQDDLMKMYKENDLPLDLNVLGKITSTFSGAKVRSLQYQFTGVPRDLAEGYLKGQTNNPIKYLAELVKAAKNHNIDAKQAGAVFQHAYNDGMGGINQDKLVKEFAKQYKNVKPFDPKSKESWKGMISTLGKIADMPFKPARALGQLSDELPRSVEVKVTKQNFMKKYGKQIGNIQSKLDEINQKIDATKGITDPFDPALQGIDKLQGQKTKLENMLNEFDRNLKREQTYRGRDIMNFSNIGRSGIAKHIKQYAAFANTGTQSKYKLARAFVERPVATLAKTALLTAPLVYAEKVMQQNLTGNDKKIYDNTPDYIKQYNYVYVHGGNVYTLPKIQELALITDPIEAILTGDKSALNSSARNVVKEAVPYQAGNVAQGLVPNQNGSTTFLHNANSPLANTIFEPTIDAIANKKIGFNHNPIAYSDAFGRKNPKANKWTLDVYKGALGNKPAADYAQYAVEQYGGDAGKYLEQLLNVAKSPKDKAKIDAAIQALNPAQDRAYGNITVGGHQVFKAPYKKSAITKK